MRPLRTHESAVSLRAGQDVFFRYEDVVADRDRAVGGGWHCHAVAVYLDSHAGSTSGLVGVPAAGVRLLRPDRFQP